HPCGRKSTLGTMSQDPPSRAVQSESTQSYQSLFQSSAEFPRFIVSYRWWEDEVTTVFWAFNIPDISRVIRYGLFRDASFPRNSLLSRNADTIDAFLKAMSEPHEQPLLGNLSHIQRVEEILRRSSIPDLELVPWSWFPMPPGHSLDARAIASAIEAESHFQFSRIAFEEIVRASLGYNASSVEWFLLQHTTLYIHLLDHLRTYPEEIPLYIEVETHLRSQSPFAHRALVQCLTALQPGAIPNLKQASTPRFEFVAGPIQRLFRDQPPSLSTILKVFSVLAIRFRRQYIHTARMDWETPFDTNILFLEYCLNSTSPEDLAHTLISTDEVDFARLSRQNIAANDVVVKRLLASWHTVSISVWECCSALPDVTLFLRECAQVLFNRCDYHSLTAVLDGLHMYAISTARFCGLNSAIGNMVVLDPIAPPETTLLVNPAQNYSNYQQHYLEHPGIPFLLPHLRDYHKYGTLEPLFHYLQNSVRERR
ncbi:hypothetical protein N7492_008457, partial [Penicillium capsulatum]